MYIYIYIYTLALLAKIGLALSGGISWPPDDSSSIKDKDTYNNNTIL